MFCLRKTRQIFSSTPSNIAGLANLNRLNCGPTELQSGFNDNPSSRCIYDHKKTLKKHNKYGKYVESYINSYCKTCFVLRFLFFTFLYRPPNLFYHQKFKTDWQIFRDFVKLSSKQLQGQKDRSDDIFLQQLVLPRIPLSRQYFNKNLSITCHFL